MLNRLYLISCCYLGVHIENNERQETEMSTGNKYEVLLWYGWRIFISQIYFTTNKNHYIVPNEMGYLYTNFLFCEILKYYTEYYWIHILTDTLLLCKGSSWNVYPNYLPIHFERFLVFYTVRLLHIILIYHLYY